jgi:hypothetical protein
MTEPATTSAVVATTITIAGVATGIPGDLILPAFCGALWALRTLPEGGIVSRVSHVAAGTLFAAWSTPALSLMAASVVPAAAGIDPSVLRLPIAALVGWGGIRLLLPRVERLIGGQQP